MDSVVPSENRFTHLRVEASSLMLYWALGLFSLIFVLWLIAPLVPWIKLVGGLLLWAQLIWWLGKHYLLYFTSSVRALGLEDDGWWVEAGDLCESAILTGEAWVSPLLIVLQYRGADSGRRYPVVLFADSADAEQLRRLRLRLRWLAPDSDACPE
ncbi:protein YgfX [Aestuariirhabdus sp. LZHN29]|uniref:protein YgfX n=1 Tax=Aestuariirhabdus sp. LZHN29 TaxID=3417462 RepID=UPI003CEF5752